MMPIMMMTMMVGLEVC